jgi:MATE family multidrug resistance protein
MKILRSKQMKNEITIIFKIAMPLVAALLAERGMQFIDTMMMGWLGATALAAGALGTALFVTAMVFSVGVLSCVGIFIVRAKVCDSRALNLNLQHGIYLALAIAFPCMLFLWFVPYFLARIGENSLVMTDTVLLLHSMVWGFPALLLFFVLREFLSAFSLTFIVMLISLVALPLTFAANYILIYGKFHLPALGIAGIGYGAAFVMWFMFVGLLVYCFKHPLVKDHVVVKQFRPCRSCKEFIASQKNCFNHFWYCFIYVSLYGSFFCFVGTFFSKTLFRKTNQSLCTSAAVSDDLYQHSCFFPLF